ncbi:hypothetical protein [Hydrogenimonas sp.]
MQQLETFYESTPKAAGFIERRYDIPSYTLNLHGPPRSGKTWLVLDYLATIPKRKHLYVDLRDLRVEPASLFAQLQGFIDRHGIETVVLDHFEGDWPLPRCRQCVVVTQAPYAPNPFMPLLEIPPLDFEEYLAFEKRHVHLEHSFSLYLRTGSLPQMAQVHETLLTMRLHEALRALFPQPNERLLFRHLAKFQGKPVTAHQLYTAMKKEARVSKDWLYGTLKAWEARKIVQWFGKLEQPRAAKRALLFDFALPASLYFEKSLMGQLYTLAAKKMLRTAPETAWTDALDLYDPATRHALLLSPFANQQSTAAKVAKLAAEIDRLGIRRITILTVANAFAFHFDTIPVRAKPFYEWILEE